MTILIFFQSIQNPILDGVFGAVTLLVNEYLILLAMCWCLWCYNKDTAYKLGFSLFLGNFSNQFLKMAFQVPRPWLVDSRIIPPDFAKMSAQGYSFPSGHTQNAVSGFGTLALHFKNKKITLLCALSIFLVAFSRIYLRVHTPVDVLGGFIISLILVLAVDKFYYIIKKKPYLSLIISIISAFVLIIFALTLKEQEMAANAYKTAGTMIGFMFGFYLDQKFIQFEAGGKKLLRMLIGITTLLVVHYFCNLLLNSIISYLITSLWITTVYPIIIKKIKV